MKKTVSLLTVFVILLSLFSFGISAGAAGTVYEYYYTLLTHDEQIAYSVIKTNIESSSQKFEINGFTGVKTSFSLVGRDQGELDGIFEKDPELKAAWNSTVAIVQRASQAFFMDHPEYFWSNGGISSSCQMATNGVKVDTSTNKIVEGTLNFKPEIAFNEPGAAYAGQLSALRQAISNINASSGTDLDKIKKIHDAVCAKVVYNNAMAQNPDAYGVGNAYNAMLTGSSVCQGYSMAVKMACDVFGIKCICVSGTGYTSSGSEGHMWNLVQLGGKWYGLDATWDDQTTVMYDFFLNGSATYPSEGFPHRTFSESHVENKSVFQVPALNSAVYPGAVPSTPVPTPTPAPKQTPAPTAKQTPKPTVAQTPEPTEKPTANVTTSTPGNPTATDTSKETAAPFTEIPGGTTSDVIATPEASAESTGGPEVEPTEKPAVTETDNSQEGEKLATEDPSETPSAKPSNEPEKTPEASKNGCGGVLSAGYLVLTAAALALVIKRNENESCR